MRNANNGFLYVFEKEITIYKFLGVRKFKRIVPFGDCWISLFNQLFSKRSRLLRSREHAIIWVIFTMVVESLHLLAFIVMMWFAIKHLLDKEFIGGIRILLINLIINLYPIMIQRYNRFRLIRTFKINLDDLRQIEIK